MSETIERKKPSGLNEFDGEFGGSEIMQVTRPGVGTYKTTVSKLRGYMSGLTSFHGIDSDDNPTILDDVTDSFVSNRPVYLAAMKVFALPVKNHQQRLLGYILEFQDKDEYMHEDGVRADKIFFNAKNGKQYSFVDGELVPQYHPVVLTQDEYDALSEKDPDTTYYIVEE